MQQIAAALRLTLQMRWRALLIFAGLVSLRAADVCDPKSLQGPYGFQISGETTISGEAKPATSLGRIVFGAEGAVSGYASVMFAGYLLGNPVTGTYEAHGDCTVSWSLQDDSGAFQHFSGTVSGDGSRVHFQQTDPGAARRGIMTRTGDACQMADLRKAYDFTLSGSFTPMSPGDAASTVDAKGFIRADSGGHFILTRQGNPHAPTEVGVELQPDCTVEFEMAVPAADGSLLPVKLRGIVVDGAREILAMQTDPGWMVAAKFTAEASTAAGK